MASSSHNPLQLHQLDISTLRENASDDVINHLFSVMDMSDQSALARTSSSFNGIFNQSIRKQLLNTLLKHLINRGNGFLSDYELNHLHITLSGISSSDIHQLNYHLKYPFRTKKEKIELIDWLNECVKKINSPTFLKIIFDLLLSDTEYANKSAFVFNDETLKDIKTAVTFIHTNKNLFYMFMHGCDDLYPDSVEDTYLQLQQSVDFNFTQDSVKLFLYYLLKNKFILEDPDDAKHIEIINKKIASYQLSLKHTDPDADIFTGDLLKLRMLIDEKATDFLIQLTEDLNMSLCSTEKIIDPCEAIIVLSQKKAIDNYCDQYAAPEQRIKLAAHITSLLLGGDRYPYSLEQQIDKLNIIFDKMIAKKTSSIRHMLLIFLIRSNSSVERTQDKIESCLYSFKQLLDSNDQSSLNEQIMELFDSLLFNPTKRFDNILFYLCDRLFKFKFEYEPFWRLIITSISSISSYEALYRKLNELSFSFPDKNKPIDPKSQSKNVVSILEAFTYLTGELPREYFNQPQHFQSLFDLATAFTHHPFTEIYGNLFRTEKFWDVFVSNPDAFLNRKEKTIDGELFATLLENTPMKVNRLHALKDMIPQVKYMSHLTLTNSPSSLSILLKLPDAIFSYTCDILKKTGAMVFVFADPLINGYCQLFTKYHESLTKPTFQSICKCLNKLPLKYLSELIQHSRLQTIFQRISYPDVTTKKLLSEFFEEKITIYALFTALLSQKSSLFASATSNRSTQSSNAENGMRPTK